jgi:alkane 1-monooxygenase
MVWFAFASLLPAGLLALACVFGGVWPLLAVLSITVLVFFMDKIARGLPVSDASGRAISLTLAAVHFPLLGLGVWALGAGAHLGLVDKLLIFTGLGLFFGQISNSNAHELIHARSRLPRRIGTALYISMLHGHHVSAHLRVHHVHAATDADPNSAPMGMGFWRYCGHVLRGEFIAGLRAENAQRARATPRAPLLGHPYIAYVAGGALALACAYAIAGGKGVIVYLGIAVYAQWQLLLSDYVQHYGLRRRMLATGKAEPVGPQHSWNAPKWYSSAMMLNAPRHSDHHMRPARAFPALEVSPDTMPILPHSLPVMAVVALVPPLWHRVMDHRAAKWQDVA